MIHPSFADLCRFAEDGVDEAERLRIVSHLEGCERCAETVTELVEMSEAASRLEAPGLPAGLWSSIESDRGRGLRPIGRETTTATAFNWGPVALASAIVVAVLLGGSVAYLTRDGVAVDARTLAAPAGEEGTRAELEPVPGSDSRPLPSGYPSVPIPNAIRLPDAPSISPGRRPATIPSDTIPSFTPFEVRPELLNRQEYAAALAERFERMEHPAGARYQTLLWAHIDRTGVVTRTQVVNSSGNAEADALGQRTMEEVARFRPARNRDEPVDVWIQIPVTLVGRD